MSIDLKTSEATGNAPNLKAFLETTSPAKLVLIEDLGKASRYPHGISIYIALPLLQLRCEEECCVGNKTSLFEAIESDKHHPSALSGFSASWLWQDVTLQYRCRNCFKTIKTYILSVKGLEAVPTPAQQLTFSGTVFKYGENPTFGPHTPAKVIKMMGEDRDYFLKGRRAENQGMGVGAFAYYRRVVENQKNRLLGEIIRVAEKIKAPEDMINDLRQAQKETQFSSALEAIKHGIPSSLLITGHNPLQLLHTALSKGVHELSDEECLERATSIRIVLANLAENIGHALKEQEELDAAVTKLLK